MENYDYIQLIMIKECSKTKLPKNHSKKSNKSQINTEIALNNQQFLNPNHNNKQKPIQQNPSLLKHKQKEGNFNQSEQSNMKTVRRLRNIHIWKAIFIGISIIQLMMELGIILLQYLDLTLNIEIFLSFIITIIILMIAVIFLTVKIKLSWIDACQSNRKENQEFKKVSFIRERSMFDDSISQSHCVTPAIIAIQPENGNEQQKKQVVLNQSLHQNTIQSNIDKTNTIIYSLTIIKFIQSIAYISITSLSLTIFIPLQGKQRCSVIIIGIFSYLIGFLSITISAFTLKKTVDLLTAVSSQQGGIFSIKQKFILRPSIIKSKPQDPIIKTLLKFTNISNDNPNETMKSLKLVRMYGQITPQSDEKELQSQIALKKSLKTKKSVLKKEINNKQNSKHQSPATSRKVEINEKKIQFFQYPETKSKKKRQGSIKLQQQSQNDIRLTSIQKKIKSKAKSLDRYHSPNRKTVRVLTTHKSTTTLQTKANLQKCKQLQ